MSKTGEISRIEAALDVLLGEIMAIDTSPRALALKDGLLDDRVRTALLDAVVLLGDRLRRLVDDDTLDRIADDVAKGPHWQQRLGILISAWSDRRG